jgi:hypothetical protein
VVALALVLALPGAPMARVFAVATSCTRCPPSCPMHRTAKPKCHRVRQPKRCHGATAGLTAPCCGQQRANPLAMTVAPALLPAAIRSWPVVRETRLRWTPPAAPERAADPPDTPPPIVAA